MKYKIQLLIGFSLYFSFYAGASTNNALQFDGVDDHVEINSLLKDTPNFSDGFSFAGWIKWGGFNGNERLIDLASGPEFANNIIIRIDGASGTLVLQSVKGVTGVGNSELKTLDVLPLNIWCHVAATIDNTGKACIYFNGVLQGSSMVNVPVNIARPYSYLGKSVWANDAYFNGSMDEVSIWNRALSQSEITNIKGNKMLGNEVGLEVYYSFDQGTALAENAGEINLLDATMVKNNGSLKAFTLNGDKSNFVQGVDIYHIPHYLNVSPSTITFSGAKGNQYSCRVKCDTICSRLNDCTWVSFEEDTVNTGSIKCITTKINDTGAKRKADIIFSIRGTTVADTLILNQEVAAVKLANRTQATGKNAQNQTVVVTSSVKWIASTNTSWITVPKDSIAANGNLTFEVTENNTDAFRTGTIFLNSRFASDTLTVVQLTFNGEGNEKSPYLISNYRDLKGLSNDLKATYSITADIDASDSRSENNGAGFIPIGRDEANPFTGTLYGNGHIISGLYINRPKTDYVGLFGTKASGTIDNLGLKDCDITGGSCTGSLVGRAYDYVQIKNCYSTGQILSTGTLSAGGLVGQIYHGAFLSNCHSDCKVNGSNRHLGGLVGFNEYESMIKDCYATGYVTGTSENVGGLLGTSWSSCSISGCYATGNVSGKSNYTGGLVGLNNGIVTNCYATGNIQGTVCVGGLAGCSNSSISDSYCFGRVNGISDVSGCVGKQATGATLSGCFYNSQTSNRKDNDGRGVPLTNKQMQDAAKFTGWNFTSVWNMTAGSASPGLLSVNNAPVALSDTLSSTGAFALSRLLLNDCDFEAGGTKLVLSVKTISAGKIAGSNWLIPDSCHQSDTLTLTYRVGEYLSLQDTLWGNECTAKILYYKENALSFDGKDDFVQINALLKDSPDFSKGFTFAGWIKWDKFNGNERLIDLASGSDFANNIIFRIDGASGVLALQSVKGITSVGNSELKTSDVLPLNSWCHVAVTIDQSGNAYIYYNGILQASGLVNVPVNVERPFSYLGKSAWVNDAYFGGSMDEVSIWNKALSQTEIANIKNKKLLGNETGLAVCYSFNQGAASSNNAGETNLQDVTSVKNNGILNSFALNGERSNFVKGIDISNIPHYLNVSPSTITFSSTKSDQFSCIIKCDTSWVCLNDCDWVTFEVAAEKPGTSILKFLTMKPNDTGIRRKNKIIFSIEGTTITDTLTLYQDIETVKLASRKKSTGKNAQNQTVVVKSPVKWKASTNTPWITVSKDSVAANGTLNFSVAENNTYGVRSGIIYLNSRFAGDTLTVVQLTLEGKGNASNPYLIGNYSDLKDMAIEMDATYRLTADINASDSRSENDGAGFEPIGSSEINSFSGTLHGGGHFISGLYINRPTTDYVALFGAKSGGAIDSLGLKECNIVGGNCTGSLAGRAYDYVQINKCYSSGQVTGAGALSAGGLVGQSYHGATISNCNSDCHVNGSNKHLGGLVGLNEYDGMINDCYATGNVAGTSENVGGLVGYNSNSCNLTGCYSSGNVTGKSNYTGGLAGVNNGSVTNCYTTGNIQGTGYVGGLVANDGSSVSNSYSFGHISGTSDVSGCVGIKAIGATLANCFYNSQTSGCQDNDGRGTPLTIKQMKDPANFTGWDFSTVWNQRSGYMYPALRSVNNAPVAFCDTLTSNAIFALSRLLNNDYDFETYSSKLAISVKSTSAGRVSGSSLLIPDSFGQGDTLTLTYRVGETSSAQNTLWGNESTAKIVYDKEFILGINSLKTEKVSIYPNLVTEGFYLNAGKESTLMVLSDISGKQLMSVQVSEKSYVDISFLNPGIYMVQVSGQRMKLIKK